MQRQILNYVYRRGLNGAFHRKYRELSFAAFHSCLGWDVNPNECTQQGLYTLYLCGIRIKKSTMRCGMIQPVFNPYQGLKQSMTCF